MPRAFEHAVAALDRAGARITELPLEMLGDFPRINVKGGLPVVEAFAWHEKLIERRGQDYDPRIRTRIERGREMTAAEYIRLMEARADFIRRFDAETAGVRRSGDADRADDRAADRGFRPGRGLRAASTPCCCATPSIINFLDRCALTLPIEPPGTAPVGLMVVGRHGEDRRLLAIGIGIETLWNSSPRRHRDLGDPNVLAVSSVPLWRDRS